MGWPAWPRDVVNPDKPPLLPDEAHCGQADIFGDYGTIGVEPVAIVESSGPRIVLCDPQEGGLFSDHCVYQCLPGPASVIVGVQVQVVQLRWARWIRAGGRPASANSIRTPFRSATATDSSALAPTTVCHIRRR